MTMALIGILGYAWLIVFVLSLCKAAALDGADLPG
jgi:hypothetical protein